MSGGFFGRSGNRERGTGNVDFRSAGDVRAQGDISSSAFRSSLLRSPQAVPLVRSFASKADSGSTCHARVREDASFPVPRSPFLLLLQNLP